MPFPYLIRNDAHSHPSNTPMPSGLLSGDGDMYYATWMNNRYGNEVSLNIYLPESNSYISYSAPSIEDDFPKYSVTLENVECLAPHRK